MAGALYVCYWGTYDREHVRNQVIIEGLRALGVQVSEVHEELWPDTGARVDAARRGLWQPRLWWRLARVYARLARRYLKCPDHQLVIVGHPGHLDLPLARLLSWLRAKPLAFDALVSLHDTVVQDRRLVPARSPSAWLLRALERLLYRLPDRILVDTDCQAAFLVAEYAAPAKRLRRVWVGAPDTLSAKGYSTERSGTFRVVYFGKFIPLHGLEHVLQAAYLLREHPEIHFELYGDGQTFDEMLGLARGLGLSNVAFYPEWLALPDLAERVAGAAACLGVFGSGAKAQRVIPIKAYLALALGLPLITADSPGARELLTPDVHALLCPAGDAESLAQCILALYRDPALCHRLAQQGHALYRECCTPKAVAAQVLDAVRSLVR